jgi:hypothetical protein
MAQKTRNNIKKNSAPPPIYTLNKGAIEKISTDRQQKKNRQKLHKPDKDAKTQNGLVRGAWR